MEGCIEEIGFTASSTIRVRRPFSSLASHTLRGHPPLRHVCLHQAGCGYFRLFVGTFGHFSVPLQTVLKSALSCVWGVILLHQWSALAVEVIDSSYTGSRFCIKSKSNGSVNYVGRASPVCMLESICSSFWQMLTVWNMQLRLWYSHITKIPITYKIKLWWK